MAEANYRTCIYDYEELLLSEPSHRHKNPNDKWGKCPTIAIRTPIATIVATGNAYHW